VRKKSVRPYVIFYTIIADEVVLVRIAHERSDWASLV
jgi:plasmid stabilization system protein ParE